MESQLPKIAALLSIAFMPLSADDADEMEKITSVEHIYRQYCMSCHGTDLRGGLAASLLDDEWVAASEQISDLIEVIADGIPKQAMPAYRETFDDATLAALAEFILVSRESADEMPSPIPELPPEVKVHQSQYHHFKVQTLTDDLIKPWALAFLSDGRMLVTDMAEGALRVLNNGQLLPDAVSGLPPIPPYGEGGLMDVEVHPNFADNGWVYLAYAHQKENAAMTRVIRGRIGKENRWQDTEVVWETEHKFYSRSGSHFGVRLLFHDDYLYLCIGDRHQRWRAQDPEDPAGAVHRFSPDGNVPKDNPRIEEKTAYPTLWSWGHRNPQGLVTNPESGAIFLVEHGPYGGDEVNLLEPGKNYGWPEVTHGREYSGRMITQDTQRPGMESPLTHWTPSIAPGGAAFSSGDPFPQWRGDLFVSSLIEGNLRRLRFSKTGDLTEEEIVLDGLRRTREVAVGPDGLLYLTAERPGRILRLIPSVPIQEASIHAPRCTFHSIRRTNPSAPSN